MKKVLLTTIHRPLAVESDTCTKNITSEIFYPQITFVQGPFSPRIHCTGWGQEMIAANIKVPVTVMHYPTKRRFLKELRNNYDYVGIGFVICTFPKALEMCGWIRRYAPRSQIVLGGYGTVLRECDNYADYVCREEGVRFFRRLLGEEENAPLNIPVFKRPVRILSVSVRKEAVIAVGLGCSRGCDFCCTSHFFDRKHISLIQSGREIHHTINAIDFGGESARNIGIMDEDFLADRNKVMEMAQLNAREVQKPILFMCFATLQSLAQYSIEELVRMGLSGVWIGIESKKAEYPKLRNVNAPKLIADLKRAGITVLASMILGYDWHDRESLEEDFQYLLSLKPCFTQFMLYSPCPQTPLYSRLMQQNRLLDVPYKHYDGFHALFRHPHFGAEELENILHEFIWREYAELGPSIFRILDVHCSGYETFKNSSDPLFQARALENKKNCLMIYPLLRLGRQKAPSRRVRKYLDDLQKRVCSEFRIGARERIKELASPIFYYYTKLHSQFPALEQPRTEIHRYNHIH